MSSNEKLLTSVVKAYAASDTDVDLVDAPSGGVTPSDKAQLRIFRIVYISKTSSANGITVGDGTIEFMVPTSLAANGIMDTGFIEGGILLAEETALNASSTAGGAGAFIVTYGVD